MPLGASWDGEGTTFALFSAHADAVELCLFDGAGGEERRPLAARTGLVWHGYLPGVGPGQRYGYRVSGPFVPDEGLLFNPAKLLIDPYARAIDGVVRPGAGRTFAAGCGSGRPPDREDDAEGIPKGIVIDPTFDWQGDRRLETPWAETVIYETHVKGFTVRSPAIREDLRGTYAGLASDEAIGHLRSLGVTAVELLPIHHIADEAFLHERGLTNYWGYSSIGFFAPHAPYAATGVRGEQVREFKGMVKALHAAGIEVILDVVYNHTGEGGLDGTTLSFRGIDNPVYYRLEEASPRRPVDFTGTGNTVDASRPDVLRLIMDSLRYWAGECHVDGFRFDLAPTLARESPDFDPGSGFLDAVHQDPLLARVKLIAEPWDVGPGGYRMGAFPAPWREWNGPYRDTMRDVWRGRAGVAAFASRLAGSSDVFGAPGRGPTSSINFVTAHDGFTLADLVAYERKRNDANLEANEDGTDDNRSWNLGVEGPSRDPAVAAARERQQRNFLATLLLSQGVPMLLGGDELGRTQGGNNNAWCQDNETSWFDWELDEPRHALLGFTRRLVRLRAENPVFRRTRFLADGETTSGLPEAWWFRHDGRKLSQADWKGDARAVGVFLNGDEIGDRAAPAAPAAGDSFVLLVNTGPEPVGFKLPPGRFGRRWRLELATADPAAPAVELAAGGALAVGGGALVLLRRVG